MSFHAEQIAMQRERFERLSRPIRVALLLHFRDGLRPSLVARMLGITTAEARLLLAAGVEGLTGRPNAR